MALEENIAQELFIANNSFDHKTLIEKITPDNANVITPNEMLHEFSTRYSLLENSIKIKDDFMVDYLMSNGANIENYKIINEVNGNERNHNPIGLAIITGNENALYNMLEKRPDLLTENHIDLLQKAAFNRELTPAEIRDVSSILEPVCKERGISFDSQSMSLIYDLKVTQQDNFKSFYNQVLNSNFPGLVEHNQSKELVEFSAILRHPDGEVIYSGDFKFGKKDGLHFNLYNNTLTVANFENGREITVPKDVEIFVALRNDNLKQIENLSSRATIDRLQPDNIDFFPKHEAGKLSLVESAIAEGKNDIAKFLIDKGSKLEPYEIKDLQTQITRQHDPVMMAIKSGNKEILEHIVDKRPELFTKEHTQEISRLQNADKYTQIKSMGTEAVIKEVDTIKELDSKLKKAVQDGNTDEAKSCILKGADVKTLDKSDFENLPDEKKHQMTEVLHSAVAEKMSKDNLGHLRLGDGDKGIKI